MRQQCHLHRTWFAGGGRLRSRLPLSTNRRRRKQDSNPLPRDRRIDDAFGDCPLAFGTSRSAAAGAVVGPQFAYAVHSLPEIALAFIDGLAFPGASRPQLLALAPNECELPHTRNPRKPREWIISGAYRAIYRANGSVRGRRNALGRSTPIQGETHDDGPQPRQVGVQNVLEPGYCIRLPYDFLGLSQQRRVCGRRGGRSGASLGKRTSGRLVVRI